MLNLLRMLPTPSDHCVVFSLCLDSDVWYQNRLSDIRHIVLARAVGIPKVNYQPVSGPQMPQTEMCPCLSEGR